MLLKNIKPEKIRDYLEGNIKLALDKLGLQPEYIQEQIIYRAENCPDECKNTGKCKYCGCDREGKLYVNKSCNKSKQLPDLMGEEDWIKYKQTLKIEKITKLP